MISIQEPSIESTLILCLVEDEKNQPQPKIEQLLENFVDNLVEPTSLSPFRDHFNHKIDSTNRMSWSGESKTISLCFISKEWDWQDSGGYVG